MGSLQLCQSLVNGLYLKSKYSMRPGFQAAIRSIEIVFRAIVLNLRYLTERGVLNENCVTIWSPGGTKFGVSRHLLNVFGFCKIFWTAKNACDTVN